MNSMKRQKDMTMKDELARLVGAQHAMGKYLQKEEAEPKQNKTKQNKKNTPSCDTCSNRQVWPWSTK